VSCAPRTRGIVCYLRFPCSPVASLFKCDLCKLEHATVDKYLSDSASLFVYTSGIFTIWPLGAEERGEGKGREEREERGAEREDGRDCTLSEILNTPTVS